MKKILMLICMLFVFAGGSCNKDVKVKINKGETPSVQEASTYLYTEYGLLSYELLNTSKYDEKITNKDSFLLFVYRESCYGCGILSPGIKNYIDDSEGAIVYSMKVNAIESTHTLYKDHNVTDTPYLILIENGEIKHKEIMPTTNTTTSQAKTWFYEWMEKHVVWEE